MTSSTHQTMYLNQLSISFPRMAAYSAELNFQIPSFVCSVTPTLALGGGAEVLPVSLLSDDQLANLWFSNNGFAPCSFHDQSVLVYCIVYLCAHPGQIPAAG